MLGIAPNAKQSRIDTYIAVCMRGTGFSREVIVDTLVRCLPENQPGQPERNWRRYAERITAYAFGVMGDVQLARGAASRAAEKREQQEREDEARPAETSVEAPRIRMR